MTAAVAPPPQGLQPSAMARKRRREILSSQRSLLVLVPDETATTRTTIGGSPNSLENARSKRKCSNESRVTESSQPTQTKTQKSKQGTTKKPQMKYDPDVPMTKEEVAVWRREQRRKRNRESAAASRQRQRDRISELEEELQDYKNKFNEVMKKLKKVEEHSNIPPELLVNLPKMPEASIVSPSSSPDSSPQVSPTASPVASSSLVLAGSVSQSDDQSHQVCGDQGKNPHLNMISLPA